MPQQLFESILGGVRLNALIDIAITALLIYWLFSLIRGTRAVRLVIGVSVLFVVYAAARLFDFQVLTRIMETGAVVGLFAVVVIFQPELRRALERIGRVGSLAWLFSGTDQRSAERVARQVSRAAARLSAERIGALIAIERETGLGEYAETGVLVRADITADLLRTIFTPRAPLHDGAVIIRGDQVLAAGALLPLAETTVQTERFGTRHRAALGITEQTDAIVVVVSEETGQVSLVERARIVRNLDQARLERTLTNLLHPSDGRPAFLNGLSRRRVRALARSAGGRAPRLARLGRTDGRRADRPGPLPPPARIAEDDAQPTAPARAPR